MEKSLECAICAIIKNEEDYIEEWINYHYNITKISKFYIYDNESTDNTLLKLKKYIEKGVVELSVIHGKDKQIDAYNDCLSKHKSDTKWIAFIDADEFIYISGDNTDINLFLKSYTQFNGLGVNWITFGPSGHINKPQGGVLENYTECLQLNHYKNLHIKSIVNTQKVIKCESPHFFSYNDNGGVVNEQMEQIEPLNCFSKYNTTSKIAIHHYYTKSVYEFMNRCAKGKACSGGWKSDIGVFKGGINVFSTNELEKNTNMLKYLNK